MNICVRFRDQSNINLLLTQRIFKLDIVLLFTVFINITASIATRTSVITNANHTVYTVPIFERMIAEVSMITSCTTEVSSVFLLFPRAWKKAPSISISPENGNTKLTIRRATLPIFSTSPCALNSASSVSGISWKIRSPQRVIATVAIRQMRIVFSIRSRCLRRSCRK